MMTIEQERRLRRALWSIVLYDWPEGKTEEWITLLERLPRPCKYGCEHVGGGIGDVHSLCEQRVPNGDYGTITPIPAEMREKCMVAIADFKHVMDDLLALREACEDLVSMFSFPQDAEYVKGDNLAAIHCVRGALADILRMPGPLRPKLQLMRLALPERLHPQENPCQR